MNAFNSEVWSVRNSGVMAFAAIMNRVVGHSQAKVSMGVLKSRSPEIESFLAANLSTIADPQPLLLLISKMSVDITASLFTSIATLLGH
jgi:hypothetical protein